VSPNVTLDLTQAEAGAATEFAAASLRAEQTTAVLAAQLDHELEPVTAKTSTAVARVLRGLVPAYALTCGATRPSVQPEAMGPSGLTPRAAALRAAMLAAFGYIPMGGFRRGGISSGHVDNSAHYEGRAIDVFLSPRGPRNTARGWTLAQWLVAHAPSYGVLSVIWSDHIWTVWASNAGWREYVHPSGNRTNPTLRHLDHIHTAVVSGRSRTPPPMAAAGPATPTRRS
jgi:hypothetical protein